MVKSGHTRPGGKSCENIDHWCQNIKKVIIKTFPDCDKYLMLSGGSDDGKLVYIFKVYDKIKYASDITFENGDVLLKIQEQEVPGFTYLDAINLLKYFCKNYSFITIECISSGYISLNLAQFLSHRFQKGSSDHELQNTIRDNLYIRTVPVTTRPPKDSEINGIDYVFLTVDEFNQLKLSGALLESGIYEGNYYGTPKPLRNNCLSLNEDTLNSLKSECFPGVHPSSEGKRKRNRSNVEAMAAKDISHDSVINSNQESRKNEFSNEMQKKNPPSYYYDSNLKYSDLEEDELGPLPPKWEKAYTENGEVYFIDHNSSTSHWLDPRLSRIQKKSLEDCTEDELPYGWERIDDPLYGTYYIDHVNRQTQYENPVIQAKYGRGPSSNSCNNITSCSNMLDKNCRPENYNHDNSYNCYLNNSSKFNDGLSENTFFTSNPDELVGERIHSTLVKSYKGLGFTIVGGDDSKEEFLQIKSIVTNGPAWYEGKLQTGDVLVSVNNKCVLGYTHHDMVSVFQSIAPGETVELEVCRGYPLPFDPNDPNTEVVTTVAVGNSENAHLNSFVAQDAYLKRHVMDVDANDVTNSSVKSMPDLYLPEKMHVPRPTSTDLILQDDKPECLTMAIVKGSMGFGFTIADSAYGQKVKKILDKQRCQNLMEGDILVEINNICVRKMCHSDVVQVLKDCTSNKAATITVERLSFLKNKLSKKEDVKLDMYRVKTPAENCNLLIESPNTQKLSDCSANTLNRNSEMYTLDGDNLQHCYSRSQSPGNELDQNDNSWNRKRSPEIYKQNENNYMSMARSNNYYGGNDFGMNRSVDVNDSYFYPYPNGSRKESTSFENEQPLSADNELRSYRHDLSNNANMFAQDGESIDMIVTIERQEAGFGFRIVGGTEEGSQVSIGHIVEGGAAEIDGRLRSGDEIVSVDNQSVMNSSHHHVVQLMSKAASNGKVTLGIRRKILFKHQNNMLLRPEVRYPYDVTVTRRENEGFGFVIISSLNKAGSAIGRIIENSPAERSGLLHVGDHILAVNGINIMNLHHGDIVNLIKDSGYSVTLTIGLPLDDTPASIVSASSHRDEEMYEGQYHAIEINRGSRGFGFSIRGGREFQNMALFVLQIAENGPASVDGRLKIGDRLIEINGINTKNMTHAQAIEIIRNGGPTVRLLVQRGGRVPSLPSEEHLAGSPSQHRGNLCSTNDSRSVILNDRPESWDTQLSS